MTQEPTRCCDLVMKGGVTSGVLYPAALQEIGKRFYLVGVGGTSAGAIAAAGAAAAVYRRRTTGTFEGYERLQVIADELSKPGRLVGLFSPDRPTRKLFALALKFLEGKAGTFDKINLGRKLMFSLEETLQPVVDNGFGLSSGMANDNRPSDGPPITEWLAREIDRIAGKQDGPLTFADLHGAPIPEGIRGVMQGLEDRSIDFRAMTTSLSFGRPFEMPFRDRIFAFDPDEWARLFPDYVMQHLIAEAEKIEATERRRDGKLPLPAASLPVVVAVRMSLSFPFLFTAVPLHAVDYHRQGNPMRRVWFSDGGITSNFPIHRFDGLVPRWPTLGINLQDADPSGRGGRRSGELVYLPKRRSDAIRDLWQAFDQGRGVGAKVFGFVGSIFRSAQVWHDNAFMRLPGYRDRVVEIWLKPDEGGLNLTMSQETIRVLADRGRDAGRKLAERFVVAGSDEAMSWDGHRWTRFRSGMAGLMETIQDLNHNVSASMTGDASLLELLADKDAPPSYKFRSEKQRRAAEEITRALLELAGQIEATGVCKKPEQQPDGPFCDGPRPRVDNGSRAPF